MPEDAPLRIGEVARATGLSVRALRHYDDLGLLPPSARTEAGHRRYTAADLARLQQIVSLRALGLPLEEIGRLLDDGADPVDAVELHLARLREQAEKAQRLVERLEGIAARLRSAEPVSADDLIHTIRLTVMFEKHYTPDQLETLRERREQVGDARIAEVQQEWKDLFATFDRHREAGTNPAAPEVQALAEKAEALIAEFTGGDSGIRASLQQAADEQPREMRTAWGIGDDLAAYYGRAMRARSA